MQASKEDDISGSRRDEPKPKPCMNPLANSELADFPYEKDFNGDSCNDGETYFLMTNFPPFYFV